MHSFLDCSGCVFLDVHSGETLSILMPEAEILKVLSGEVILDKKVEQAAAIQSLIHKGILISLSNESTDVR